MFSLTWLPKVLRDAGLKVEETPNWQTRGQGDVGKIELIICHHTAEKVDADLHPNLDMLEHGREGLRGCLSQLGLGQNGIFYIIAAGKAWHAGEGHWPGVVGGNEHAIGIEAENNGIDEPWPAVQMEAYARGCAALATYLKLPYGRVIGHKEWTTRKVDPDFNMADFRKRVYGYMQGPGKPVPTPAPTPKPPLVASTFDLVTLRAMGELMVKEAGDPKSLRGLRASMVLEAANEIERLLKGGGHA